jgi:hypothetical protein
MYLQQNGSRVFYWDVNGTIKYGTVESASRMTDVSLNDSIYDNLPRPHFATGDSGPKRESRRRNHCQLAVSFYCDLHYCYSDGFCICVVCRVFQRLHRVSGLIHSTLHLDLYMDCLVDS